MSKANDVTNRKLSLIIALFLRMIVVVVLTTPLVVANVVDVPPSSPSPNPLGSEHNE